jgi:hypothetical protein
MPNVMANLKEFFMNINEIVVNYIQVWNERNDGRRSDLIAKTWSEEGNYVDPHRSGTGHDEINEMVRTAQSQHPGYALRLVSGIDAHKNFVRFSWQAGGTTEAPLLIGGTDVAILSSDGRIKSIIGFIDAMPVPTCAAPQLVAVGASK